MAKKPTGAAKKGIRGKVESRSKEKATETRKKQVRLVLVPLIDTFVILCVFLFQNFSAEGDIMSVAPDLTLPESVSEQKPKTSVIIAITNNSIVVEGREVMKSKDALKDPDLVLDPLLAEMLRIKQIKEAIAKQNPDRPFKGEATIQGDKLITFELIKRVMYTCGRAEFGNIALAVLKRELSVSK
ncbi:MAG: ExbD/TolR family protein [bacterium]